VCLATISVARSSQIVDVPRDANMSIKSIRRAQVDEEVDSGAVAVAGGQHYDARTERGSKGG
jgi:hypothetical protein